MKGNIVLIFISALLISTAIFCGCRKSNAEEETLRVQSSTDYLTPSQKLDVIVISPSSKDSPVDVYAHIVVHCNTAFYSRRLKISRFIISGPEGAVNGKYIFTDTSAEFVPSVNLKMSTRYNVNIEGFVTRQIDHETEAFKESFSRNINFVTVDTAVYIMERRSQQVTAFARDGSRMIQNGDYLYLYGGWLGGTNHSDSYNDIYRSSGDLTEWERMPDAPWQGRHIFGLGKIKNEIYVYGGDQHTEFFDVWKSSDGIHFTRVVQDLENRVKSRLVYGTCTHNNKLFIVGGQRSLDIDMGMTDVWSSPNGQGWKRMTNDATFFGKNISGVVASFNGKLYVVGGGYYQHPDTATRWTNHIYSSVDGITWMREPDAPWQGRQFADICVWDNRLWMIGGHNGANLAEIWYMDTDGTWTEYIPSNLFTARHASAVAVYNDQLVIACGDLNNECWVIRRP